MEFLLEFVEEVEGILTLAIHFVDEHDDGGFAHSANGHEFACLRLHAFGAIHDDDGRVNSSQRAECVLGEVLVAWGVENVDFVIIVVELHDGGGDRDTALLFYLHPVGGGSFFDFVALDSSCHLNLSAEEEEFLGECCFTRIGVRNDGECSPAFYFGIHKKGLTPVPSPKGERNIYY